MPNGEDDIEFKKLMEKLADKYEATRLELSPEYRFDDEYVFTFQIPKKFDSKEYNEIWDNLVDEAEEYATKQNKKYLNKKYGINLKR